MIEKALPIGEVTQRFGIRASALRYYEEIALLEPTERRSGRRYYGPKALKRLVLIQLLQDTGRLSLEEIADILAKGSHEGSSRRILNDRIAVLNELIRSAEAAKNYLEYRLTCPREDPFDGCPVLAKELTSRLERADSRVPTSDVQTTNTRERHSHPKQISQSHLRQRAVN